VSEPIISVSGLRGIVGQSLTPEVAIRYAVAFSVLSPAGPLVITRDSRPSGAMLAEALHAALHAAGRATIDAGIAATPTTGILVRQLGAAGGIQISASHNPPAYNGLKLFSAEGRVIPSPAGAKVLEQYRTGTAAWASHDRLGTRQAAQDTLSSHLDAVLATVHVDRIRQQRFRVLLDSNHGAGGLLGRHLLDELGCEVTLVGGTPDGQFEHPAEPTAENLASVLEAVPAAGADVGFCQDPDADRLAVIDASGRYLGEEYTLALCVAHVLERRRGPIVANCSTSRMAEDIARQTSFAAKIDAVTDAARSLPLASRPAPRV
jgi:phosphomannomutase